MSIGDIKLSATAFTPVLNDTSVETTVEGECNPSMLNIYVELWRTSLRMFCSVRLVSVDFALERTDHIQVKIVGLDCG